MRNLSRCVLLVIAAMICATASAAGGVRNSLHNLSSTGPGNVKSNFADEICEFCHISHSTNSRGPLWSRINSGVSYTPYTSNTAIAEPGQPTGTSLLCLSCHDGTIALGKIINRGADHSMAGGNDRMPPGKGLTGTDLSDDHPISFEYSDSLASQSSELAMPGNVNPQLRLDNGGALQCTTCHDAHDSPYGKLLKMSNMGSQLCIECHRKSGWENSSHSQSAASWNRRPPDPWRDSEYSTVADNGCNNCHLPHSAGGEMLLKYSAEEEICANCHNGNVAAKDVMESFANLSAHGLADTMSLHDPTEPAVIESRHVECVDCHDPHATQAGRTAGDVPANVRGVSLGGVEVERVSDTYEICLRCHGDSPSQNISRTPRQHDQANMRLKIQTNNPSFHPVAGPGRSSTVPSLIEPLNEQSIVGCTDCHNSSSAASVGGAGPEGPHGSEYEPILSRHYMTIDNTPESAFNYALCYACHSRDSILNDESFPEHDKHIRGENTPCNVCHDPHGISATQGNDTNNSHLINFDVSVVSPNSNGQLDFVDEGDRAGSCNLSCHGEDHDNFNY